MDQRLENSNWKRKKRTSGFRRRRPLKLERKRIAERQIEKLIDLALEERRDNQALSKRHATLAWKMATRFNVKLREKRRLFCHFCKQFIVPPFDARYRLSSKREGVILITCLLCNKTYRQPLGIIRSV